MGLFGPDPKPASGDNKANSIFDKNNGMGALRSDVNGEFIKMMDKTTAGGSHIMKIDEKRHLEHDLFPAQEYGTYISIKDIDNKIKKLNEFLSLAKRQGDRYQISELQDKIDFLKELKNK